MAAERGSHKVKPRHRIYECRKSSSSRRPRASTAEEKNDESADAFSVLASGSHPSDQHA
jgi:hypothetical protein